MYVKTDYKITLEKQMPTNIGTIITEVQTKVSSPKKMREKESLKE